MITPEYNILSRLPLMQYKIIEHLVKNNEDIWKLLKYPESNALENTALSISEKSELIYPGGGMDADKYRVFMDILSDDSFTQQSSLIRIYPLVILPKDRIRADVTFCIQVLCHSKITQLCNYTNRNVYMFQQIIETLNGSDINGVGLLAFDKMGNPNDRIIADINNNRNYQGYSIYMSTHTSTLKGSC